jgi:hypothetical protein
LAAFFVFRKPPPLIALCFGIEPSSRKRDKQAEATFLKASEQRSGQDEPGSMGYLQRWQPSLQLGVRLSKSI